MRSSVRGNGLAGTTNLALLAPVREGRLAPAFEPVSYRERLCRLLDAMHASRRNARESRAARLGLPRPDRTLRDHQPLPVRAGAARPSRRQRWHLSLNVTFDGGWEPYMRVIYRDIGPLLDALLCHCEGYPGSRTSDFDTYCRWVRKAELDAGIYYTDPPATLGDQHYLASVERLQRESSTPADRRRAIAAHAEPDDITAMSQGLADALRDLGAHLPLQLRALKGLYRLTSFWAGSDGDILLRFAQLVLAGFQNVIKAPAFINHPAAPIVNHAFADELAWLARPLAEPAPDKRLACSTALLQGALLDDGPRATMARWCCCV